MIVTVEDALKIYDTAWNLCQDTIKNVEEKRAAAQLEREKWGRWERFRNKYWFTDYLKEDQYFENQLYYLNRELTDYQNEVDILEYQVKHFGYKHVEISKQLFLEHYSSVL